MTPRDQACFEAEKKIESANNHPRTTTTNSRMPIRHPFIRFAKQSVENKGGKHGS
ncbi:MAG: hypothetical protein HY863_07820 [Chloroflexi bacterium]|nr:hypothetical protein [Chloroflexota bacterium]